MKKNILGLFILGVFILGLSFASAITYDNSDSVDEMLVKVNIHSSTVSISVPDNLVLEDIAPGYISDEERITIVNTGTTDVQVIPELGSSNNTEIFEKLGFKTTLSDDLVGIGFFGLEILKPTKVGEENSEYVYAQLDLVAYEGEISEDQLEYNTTIIFTAVPL